MKKEYKVITILKRLSDIERINKTDDLQQDLFLDSLSLVNLLIEIEEQYNIELKETDLNPFDLKTVQDVIDLVERYI